MNIFKIVALLGLRLCVAEFKSSISSLIATETGGLNHLPPLSQTYPPTSDTKDPVCETDYPLITDQTTLSFTETLKQAYLKHSGITLPFEDGIIPFSELYIGLELKGRVNLAGTEANKPLSFNSLSDRVDLRTGQPIHHTWIEGVAGTGKTTLVKYILHSWASTTPLFDIQYSRSKPFFGNYKAILYLPLRHILRLFTKREKPYRYSDLLEKSQEWQHWALMDRSAWLAEAHIQELALLFNRHSEQVLLLVDGLDEIDPNHPLLRDVLLNPNLGHDFIITTRPQKIPAWLESHIDREIIVQGFDETARDSYITKYYERLTKKGYEKSKEAEILKAWVKNQKHMDAFMAIPLNCHLICVISSDGSLPIDPTNTVLYDTVLIQWIKRALTKSASMREAYHIQAATELDILTAIREQYNDVDLLHKSQAWVSNLEVIAFNCIQAGDNITVSGEQIAAGIRAQDPEISHKDLMSRMQELIFFGILSPRGISEDKLGEIFEYTHKTFLEYMAGRFIAAHYQTADKSVTDSYSDLIHELFFSSRKDYGFYQPRLSLTLRFATGALNRLVKGKVQSETTLYAWINELIQAYQKSFWGSGALLQVFSCLVEIDQNYIIPRSYVSVYLQLSWHLLKWALPGSHTENDFSQIDNHYVDTTPITDMDSLKIAMMRMIWGYTKADIVIRKFRSFDGNLARLWRMAFLEMGSSAKISPSFIALKQRIQADTQETSSIQLQNEAKKVIDILGPMQKELESTSAITPFIMPQEEPWVQKCLEIQLHDVSDSIKKYDLLRQLLSLFNKTTPEKNPVLAPFVSETFRHTLIELIMQFYSHPRYRYHHIGEMEIISSWLISETPSLPSEKKRSIIDFSLKPLMDPSLDSSHQSGLTSNLRDLAPFIKTLDLEIQGSIFNSMLLTSQQMTNNHYGSFVRFNELNQLAPSVIALDQENKKKILDKLIYAFYQSHNGEVMAQVTRILGSFCSEQLMPELSELEGNYTDQIRNIFFSQLDREDATGVEWESAASALTQLLTGTDWANSHDLSGLLHTLINRASWGGGRDFVRSGVLRSLAQLANVMGERELQQILGQFALERIANRTEDQPIRSYSVEILQNLLPIVDRAESELRWRMVNTLITTMSNKTEQDTLRRSSAEALGSLATSIDVFTAKDQLRILNALNHELNDEEISVICSCIEAMAKLVAAMPILLPSHQVIVINTLLDKLDHRYAGNFFAALEDAFVSLAPVIAALPETDKWEILNKLMSIRHVISRPFAKKIMGYLRYFNRPVSLGLNPEEQTMLASFIADSFNETSHDETDLHRKDSYCYDAHRELQRYAPLIELINPDGQELVVLSMALQVVSVEKFSNFNEHYEKTIEAIAPVIFMLDANRQRRIVDAIVEKLHKIGDNASLNQAVHAIDHLTNPFAPGDVNDSHFRYVKPLLLAALQSQRPEMQLTADDLFNFTRKPANATIDPISFEILKARIQWLLIVSYYPAFFFQIQAKYKLMELKPELEYTLRLDFLLNTQFDPGLVLSALKLFLIGWQLPSTIQGSSTYYYQTMGKNERFSSNAPAYAAAFADMEPGSVRQGKKLLIDYIKNTVINSNGVVYMILDILLTSFLLSVCVCCLRCLSTTPAQATQPDMQAPATVASSLTADILPVKHEDIIRHEPLGSGGFSTVYRATWEQQPVAAKVLKNQLPDPVAINAFKTEVQALIKLRHPNVVQLYTACFEIGHLTLVLELMSQSLSSRLHKDPEPLSLIEQRHISLQVATGLAFLHGKSILHRDLKSNNILLGSHGEVKIADFGLAQSPFGSAKSSGAGTDAWMAPEVLREEPNELASDIYSLAIVFWEIAHRQEPWQGRSGETIVYAVAINKERPPISHEIPRNYSALICSCWHDKPAERATISDVVNQLAAMAAE